MKELKLWNGRHYGVFRSSEYGKDAHLFIAAYSAADARRVCVECGGIDPGATEVSKYWSQGSWGNSMDGIEPKRGMWITRRFDSKPEFVEARKDQS